MDTSKIIKGVVGGGRYTVTSPIVKEDYGLYLKIEGLELPSTYEVDFSNSEHNGTSVTMIGNSDGVLIPHQFIDSGKDIFAFLYHVGVDFGRTVYKFRIPNKVRPDRTNEQPTPEEQSTIDQAISALNDAVAQTAQDVIDADASAQSAQGYAESAEGYAESASTSATEALASETTARSYANSASASATASAQSASQAEQIKSDVEGMVDDAQASASASAQRALASANSASQASGYAQSASASAQSASGYASQAQTSAQTASAKAQDASGYAQTATQKATESAQSASQALTYKTDAESAKTASQTAQGLAEQAQTGAETAQGLAEDARDEAQSIVDGISGKVGQIDSNTDRIESLEDDRYKPYPTDTASGAVASFSDGADGIPLKSLIVNIDPVQDTSSGDPSPENICPISGWTEVDVEQSGVNVWDEEWEVGIFNANGEPSIATDRIRSKNFCPCVPNTEYYFVIPSRNMRIYFYNENREFLDYYGYWDTSRIFTTPANAYFFKILGSAAYGTTYNHDISINYPSTDHDYHPYTGRSITIDLGQTVYGGKLYPLEGKAVVDRAFATKKWGQMSSVYSGTTHSTKSLDFDANVLKGGQNSITNITATYIEATTAQSTHYYVSSNLKTVYVALPNDTNTDTDIQVCGTLAEPIEIQLDAHAINSLYGVNNIWADSGDTSCEYRADTKLFIERLTTPDSADMIADANITSGKYFMVGNSLYKATANIANGSAIVVGTNCIRKSLSEALNEINA